MEEVGNKTQEDSVYPLQNMGTGKNHVNDAEKELPSVRMQILQADLESSPKLHDEEAGASHEIKGESGKKTQCKIWKWAILYICGVENLVENYHRSVEDVEVDLAKESIKRIQENRKFSWLTNILGITVIACNVAIWIYFR